MLLIGFYSPLTRRFLLIKKIGLHLDLKKNNTQRSIKYKGTKLWNALPAYL